MLELPEKAKVPTKFHVDNCVKLSSVTALDKGQELTFNVWFPADGKQREGGVAPMLLLCTGTNLRALLTLGFTELGSIGPISC